MRQRTGGSRFKASLGKRPYLKKKKKSHIKRDDRVAQAIRVPAEQA
jgi:hypothetical protein